MPDRSAVEMNHRLQQQEEDEDKPTRWTIDHKIQVVPLLALAVVLIGYAVVGVQQVSKLDSRLIAVEVRNAEQDAIANQKFDQQNKNFEKLWTERDVSRDRLSRLEEKLSSLLDIVQRIDRRLEPGRRTEFDTIPPELRR